MRSLLGVGGMGEVYLAQDLQLRRSVALKLLPPQFTLDAERLRRFKQEAFAASSLNHPNILTIFEIGQHGDTHFIATEYIDGRSLRQLITQEPVQLFQILDWGTQIASALAAAHAAGIIHRDIKPDNISVGQVTHAERENFRRRFGELSKDLLSGFRLPCVLNREQAENPKLNTRK